MQICLVEYYIFIFRVTTMLKKLIGPAHSQLTLLPFLFRKIIVFLLRSVFNPVIPGPVV